MNTAGEINAKIMAIGTWANLTPKQKKLFAHSTLVIHMVKKQRSVKNDSQVYEACLSIFMQI
jgi:hypothetical protein